MKYFFQLYLLIIFYVLVECRQFSVSNGRQLGEALRTVTAGDVIQLADGVYSGLYSATAAGSSNAPITLSGTQRAVITNPIGTAIDLRGQFWRLTGFTIQNSRRAVVMRGANNNMLDGLTINIMGETGILIRQSSSANIVKNCVFTRIGGRSPQIGYAILIGSDSTFNRGVVDRSNLNQILTNSIQTGSPVEAIQAYGGTCCGVIGGNTINGRPFNYNSNISRYNRYWVSVSGSNYTIINNSGRNTAADGFRIIMVPGADGCNNLVRSNICEMNTNGFCVNVLGAGVCAVAVSNTNTKTGTGQLCNVGTVP